MDRLIPKKEVRFLCGFSFAEISRKEEAFEKTRFPQRIRIGSRVFWSLLEIQKWIEDRKGARPAR